MRRLAVVLVVCASLQAHDAISTKLTWTREISRLVIARCGRCHHEGGPAPMALLSYAEARPWAKAIKEEVLERRMPPWGAVKGFGEFAGDPSLSQEEMHLIADWVEGGAPEGDRIYLPTIPYLWAEEEAARFGREIGVGALRRGARVAGLRVEGMVEGGGLKAAAIKPDGTVEPLIWVYGYREKWKRSYRLASPLWLPAGTRIEVEPRGAGKLVLLEDGARGAGNASETNTRRVPGGNALSDRRQRP